MAFFLRPLALDDLNDLHKFAIYAIENQPNPESPEATEKIRRIDFWRKLGLASQSPKCPAFVAVRVASNNACDDSNDYNNSNEKEVQKNKDKNKKNIFNVISPQHRILPRDDTRIEKEDFIDTSITRMTDNAPSPISHVSYSGSILGFIYLSPSNNHASYQSSRLILKLVAPLKEVGPTVYKDILKALIEHMVSTLLEHGPPFRNLLAEFPFLESVTQSRSSREAFIESGFEEVGKVKKHYDRNGVLYDRLSLQIEL